MKAWSLLTEAQLHQPVSKGNVLNPSEYEVFGFVLLALIVLHEYEVMYKFNNSGISIKYKLLNSTNENMFSLSNYSILLEDSQ